jgi:hypothetical protein
MRAQAHRPLVLILSGFLLAGAVGCVDPYGATSESLTMPKKKKPKAAPVAADKPAPYGGLVVADTCKTDFTGAPQGLPKQSAINKANSLAQDADNTMAGVDTAKGTQRQAMVNDALATLNDALRANPYSPLATYTSAKAYAAVGKKKCSLAMLDRLNTLGAMPELTGDVGKLKARAKNEPVFEPFRKEADGALGGQ